MCVTKSELKVVLKGADDLNIGTECRLKKTNKKTLMKY